MMPGLYRIWSKVRQIEARQWEAKHRRPFLAHQAGKSITDIVFRQSLKAEDGVACQDPLHSGAVLWGLSNYYEHISHQTLIERAHATGFSSVLLKVILNQYSSTRLVATRDLVQLVDHPTRGIAAGCGWATFLVQVYSLSPLDAWAEANSKGTDLQMFIDDLFLGQQRRDPQALVRQLQYSAARLAVLVTEELECKLALHKAQVSASTTRLRRQIRKALGKYAGPQDTHSATNLGIDSAAGASRLRVRRRVANATLYKRFVKHKQRRHRIRAVKIAGGDTRKLWKTGLQQALTHGTEVVGMDPQELQNPQTEYLKVAGPRCATRSRSLSLAVLGDPTWRAGLGPALTWSTMIWRAAMDKAMDDA
jgi:hypothetical protein